jgi:hypothetical protein
VGPIWFWDDAVPENPIYCLVLKPPSQESFVTMEQVLTRPTATTLRSPEIAERLLRCALIEEAVAAALAAARTRTADPEARGRLQEHAARDEEHAERLRALAWEMMGPGRNGSGRPDPDLVHWLELLSDARCEVESFAGLYGVLKFVLADAYRDLIAAVREEDPDLLPPLSQMLCEEEASIAWGWERLKRLAALPTDRALADDRAEHLRLALRAAGDIWGDMPRGAAPRRPFLPDR